MIYFKEFEIVENKSQRLLIKDSLANVQIMFQIFFITLAIIAVAVALLCIKLYFGQKFVHTHIDGNRALNKKGIHCVQSLDRKMRKPNPNQVSERRKKETTQKQ